MPHINIGPGENDLTASAFIVKDDLEVPRLMLHRHKILGVFLQFGGHVEPKENIWQAAIREVLHEETGYEPSQLEVFQPKIRIGSIEDSQINAVLHPVPTIVLSHHFPGLDHTHTDFEYVFVTSEDPIHEVEESESKTIECFTLEELSRIDPKYIYDNIRSIGKFILTDVYENFERVELTSFLV